MNVKKIIYPRDIEINKQLLDEIIKKHQPERERILKLKSYYEGNNAGIKNRAYKDNKKPMNRIYSGYAAYITDNFTGYFMAKPVSYRAKDKTNLEGLQDIMDYNDEAHNNAVLAQEQSICGYAYEMLYFDEYGQVRFSCVETEDLIVIYDNTLENNILFAIRLAVDEDQKGSCYVYLADVIQEYDYEGEVKGLKNEERNYINEVPVVAYENNRQRIGDFERQISLIDAYDQTTSDTANDFEYFTNAILVIKGNLARNEDGSPLNFKDNRLLQFPTEEGGAEYLLKDLNDTALENYKNRLNNDIHKFSSVIDLNDENFGSNLSGISLRYKLLAMENVTNIKEANFRKGLLRRIELISEAPNSFISGLDFTSIKPVFVRNIPENETEIVEMITKLAGIVSEETLLTEIPFIVENVKEELSRLKNEREDGLDEATLGGGLVE